MQLHVYCSTTSGAILLMWYGTLQLKSEGKVVEGNPGSHAVAEAQKLGADAIVVGSHGRNIIGRTLLGSTSDYIRHNSTRESCLRCHHATCVLSCTKVIHQNM